MKQLKMLIQEEKHCPDMGQWNEFQDEIDKERISHEKLGHKLTAQEVIITELHCELDKYKPSKGRYERRIQELTTAFDALKNTQEAERARNKGEDEKLKATSQSWQYQYQQLEEDNQKLRCAAKKESMSKCISENEKVG